MNSELQRYIPAEELKKTYGVFGHFYSVELPSKEVVECRSVLELIAKPQIPPDPSAISLLSPDAVFIMMNPGSSKPLVDVNNHLHVKTIHQLQISLVPTRPDTTQYQLMRLMQVRNWQHVRVLNLSDLRCAKSPEFIQKFQRLEKEESFDSHSIFSDSRTEELSRKLPKEKTAPVVLAWGMSEKLNPLIERCLGRLGSECNLKGVLEPGTVNKYRHPLPTLQRDQLIWLAKIVRHFEE